METSYKRSYIVGFVLSVVLTLAAYFAVISRYFTTTTLALTIAALAVTQFIVQLIFFLRLNQEKKPHWKLTVFFFMLLVLIVIVFGSLWIMYSLNYNLMAEPRDY